MSEANPDKRFVLYGQSSGMKASDLRDLDAVQAETSDSGCEGMYCEVARWNYNTKRYEKFAFQKFFGNDEQTEYEEADMYTKYINRGWVGQGFVHSMPTYEEKPVCQNHS